MPSGISGRRYTSLIQELADLYGTEAAPVAKCAELNLRGLNLTGSPLNIWNEVVSKAETTGRLRELVECAMVGYETDATLREVLEELTSTSKVDSSKAYPKPDEDMKARALRDKFFGLDRQPKTRIVLSRLQILPSGTMPVGNEDLSLGYSGPAINYGEYEGARALLQVLEGDLSERDSSSISVEVSPLYEKKDAFRQLLNSSARSRLRDKVHMLLRIAGREPKEDLWEALNLDDQAKAAPVELFAGHTANLILLGNGMYNLYAQVFSEDFQFRFCKMGVGERSYRGLQCVPQAKRKEISGKERVPLQREFEILGRRPGPANQDRVEVGVIDRIECIDDTRFEEDDGPYVVVICAGTGSRATKACALWLAKHWQDFNENLEYLPSPDGERQTLPLFLKVKFRRERDGGKDKGPIDNPDDGILEDDIRRGVDKYVEVIPLSRLREWGQISDVALAQNS